MKMQSSILAISLLAISFLVSCNSDDETPAPAPAAIVGLWTFDTYVMDVDVNGKNLITYLIEDMEMDPAEAEVVKNLMTGSFASEFEGSTIRFNANGTFETTNPDGSKETGTYELKDNGKKLVTTSSEEVSEFDVKTLTNNQMVIAATETVEDDLNEDGIDDDLLIDLTMTFKK